MKTNINLPVIALLGLIAPNVFLLHWLFYEYDGLTHVLHNNLALAFIIDALIAMTLLAYSFATQPIGKIKWYWFVVLSLAGGMAFSIPFYWWLNKRQAA
jgi:hypothetical protein